MKLKKFQKMITTIVSIFIILTTVWIMPIASEDIPNEAGGIEETTEQVTVSDDTNTIEDTGEQVQQPSKEDSSDIVSDQVNEDVIIDDSNTDEVIEDTETTIVDEEITEPVEEDVSFFAMLRAPNLESVDIERRDEINTDLDSATVIPGKVEENVAQTISKNGKNYKYKETRIVQNNDYLKYITVLYIVKYEGKTYYSNNGLSGTFLEDNEKIVAVYEEEKNDINIKFEVYVDWNKQNNYNNYVDLPNISNGNAKSKEGESFSFVVLPKKGFTVDKVKIKTKELNVTDGSYNTEKLSQDTTIEVYLNEIKRSRLVFDGYNLQLTYNGNVFRTDNDSLDKQIDFDTHRNINFKINAINQDGLDDVNNNKRPTKFIVGFKYKNEDELKLKELILPEYYGDSRTTDLGDGIKVKITAGQYAIVGNNTKYQPYDFNISSTNGRIYDKLYMNIGYQTVGSNEILSVEKGISNLKVFEEGKNEEHKLDGIKGICYNNFSSKKNHIFYFDVMPGYAPGSTSVQVFVGASTLKSPLVI